MNTKIEKLKELHEDSKRKGELVLTNLYEPLLNKIKVNIITDNDFDKILFLYLEELLNKATRLYKKKKFEESGKETFYINTLSSYFLKNQYTVRLNLENNKFELIDRNE